MRCPLPTWRNTLLEPTGLFEIPRLALRTPFMLNQRADRCTRVLVLPGFGADDYSTWPLRAYLSQLGHETQGWGLGTNRGDVAKTVEKVGRLVEQLTADQSGRVAIVGWSLGGYIAREVARDLPRLVERVICFGSPVIGGPKYTRAADAFLQKGYDVDEIEKAVEERKAMPLKVPVTAIYSRRDGVVSWQACVDTEDNELIEHVEVTATHIGLGFSPEVYAIVAGRLAMAQEASQEPNISGRASRA